MGEQSGIAQLFSHYRYFWLAFSIVIIDQLVKLVVKFSMRPYEELRVFGEYFRINFIENKGAAFGLTIADIFQKIGISLTEDSAKMALTMFSVIAIVVIVYLLGQSRGSKSRLPIFLAFILGGAIGNIIDRIFYGVWFAGINDYEGGLFHGRVVDLFYIDVYHGNLFGMQVDLLPVFNVADLAIAFGIVAIILFQRRLFRQIQNDENEAQDSKNNSENALLQKDGESE